VKAPNKPGSPAAVPTCAEGRHEGERAFARQPSLQTLMLLYWFSSG
jgi:hypothetical protein